MKKEMSLEELVFQNDTSKNEKGQTVLGHLEGPCADFLSPTRNGRLYSEDVWEEVFNDPITKEYFESGGIFGELCHPEREEVDLEKVAICMPAPPVKNSDGKLIGRFDILDTPCGRILKTLCEYGYRLGISSRGNGDLETDYEGNESVVPSTYRLTAFDIVTLPAVKEARLTFNESLKKPFSRALTEALETSTADEKKIMIDTLNELKIDYDPESKIDGDNIVEISDEPATVDDGAKLIEELQKALENKLDLESQLTEALKTISVCNAKEKELRSLLAQSNSKVVTLTEQVKSVEPLKKRVSVLESKLDSTKKHSEKEQATVSKLTEDLSNKVSVLNEKVGDRESKIKSILQESLTQKTRLEEQLSTLKTEVSDLKSNSAIKNKEYSSKLQKADKLVEGYKKVANDAVTRYINSQARILGVSPKDIKGKLNERYTLDDVDRVCDDLREYKLNISSLPFSIQKQSRVKITESKETPLITSPYDDVVDDSLFQLLNK